MRSTALTAGKQKCRSTLTPINQRESERNNAHRPFRNNLVRGKQSAQRLDANASEYCPKHDKHKSRYAVVEPAVLWLARTELAKDRCILAGRIVFLTIRVLPEIRRIVRLSRF